MRTSIKINLIRLSDTNLITKADYIVTCMTGNPHYPTPLPSLTDVQTALNKFTADVVAASGKDKILIAEKNKSRKDLLSVLRSLGLYVMGTTPDDEAALNSSGFPMSKTPEPGYLTHPEDIKVRNGNISGQLVCRVKPVKYAGLYSHEITSTAPGSTAQWTSTRSSKSSYTHLNLQPGTKYWFRVGAIRADEIAYSQIASVHAQ